MRRLIAIASLALTLPATASVAADCTCRAQGRDHTVGTTICLSTPSGFRLATCDMMLNNTTWRFSTDSCVSAEASPPDAAASVAVRPQVPPAYAQAVERP